MKVAVVGTLLWDTIRTWHGASRQGPGGIAYNVAALASVLGPEDRVIPVCWLGGEHLSHLRTDWKNLIPPLDFAYVCSSPAGSDTNELTYHSPTRRREVMRLRCPPVTEAMIDGVRDADLILFNAITGREFGLRTVRQAVETCRGILMLDVHCLVCRLGTRGDLTRQRWAAWREWTELFDVVQCNEEELGLMVGPHGSGLSDIAGAIREVLLAGPKCVVVTLASEGSVVGWRHDAGTRYVHTPAVKPSTMVDQTGCGDSYSAGFICGYVRSGDPREAAILGTVVASTNCEAVGVAAFRSHTAGRSADDAVAAEADRLRRAQQVIESPH
jgi:sugar/nucleoside kinase (ribokinase family)